MNHFKGKQFEKEVIIVDVGYYLRYSLSYREISEILLERGIKVCHKTIYRWVQEYSEKLYKKWCYLYRAIDKFGETIDICLRKLRDTNSAKAFFNRLFKKYVYPRCLVTDKTNSIKSALHKLDELGYEGYHTDIKYLNNRI